MDLGREGKGRPKPQPKLKGIIGSVLRRRIKQCEQELQPNVVKLLTQAPVLFEHPHSGDPAAPAAFGADLREPNECGPRTTGFGRTGSHAAHAALAVRGADGKIRRAHSADRDVTCSECSTLFPPRGWSAPGLQAAGHVGDIMAWRSMSAAFEAPAASYALSMSHTMCAGATLGEGHSNDTERVHTPCVDGDHQWHAHAGFDPGDNFENNTQFHPAPPPCSYDTQWNQVWSEMATPLQRQHQLETRTTGRCSVAESEVFGS